MNITIQSLKFKASDDLLALINDKVGKLDDHGSRIFSSDVTLYKGSKKNPDDNYCELQVKTSGNTHFVKKSDAAFENAVALAVHAMQQIIAKEKEKNIDKNRTLFAAAE